MSNHSEQIMPLTSEANVLQALLVEYQIHGAELAKRLEIQDRHVTILQGFALAVSGAIAAIFSQQNALEEFSTFSNETSSTIATVALLVALSITLQFGTSTIASSYMFMILRRRMAEIEVAVNVVLQKPDLMRYERTVARNFLEQPKFSQHTTSPTFASALTTYSTLFFIVLLLAAISAVLLPPKIALAYCTTALYWYAFMVWKAVDTVGAKGQKELDAAYQTRNTSDRVFAIAPILAAISTWIAIVLLIHWAVFDLPSPSLLRDGHMIAAYTFLTGTVFPLPSEAPVFFVKSPDDIDVFIYAAAGKGLSAIILTLFTRSALLAWWPVRQSWILDRFRRGASGVGIWLVYFTCQALPLFPMRTSTVAIASVTTGVRAALGIAFICCCGTIFRMLLVLAFLSFGISLAQDFPFSN